MSKKKYPDFLKAVFLDYADKKGEKRQFGDGCWLSSDLLIKEAGLGYVAFRLKGKTRLQVTYTNLGFKRGHMVPKGAIKRSAALKITEDYEEGAWIIMGKAMWTADPLPEYRFPPSDLAIELSYGSLTQS